MSSELKALLDKYLTNSISEVEQQQLFQLLGDPAMQEYLEAIMDEQFSNWETAEDARRRDRIFKNIRISIHKQKPAKIIQPYRWTKVLVAASIVLAIVLGGYFMLLPGKKPGTGPIVSTEDIKAPDKNRAAIRLADGRVIYLDSANNGTLVMQNNVQVIKTADGKIAYNGTSGELVYNTLVNPKGSRVIDMQLSDGSHVWLNTGSSITYPVAFTGKERKVTITGEAYFEVAHDAGKPFYVSTGDISVQVLGTHFNVNAYNDEPDIRVTLLEGSVRVSMTNGEWSMLKPGQQAVVAQGSGLTTQHPDLDEVMAWKNGRFEFGGHTIEPIMRQVAKWYDVEIEYQGARPTDNFMGGTSRYENMSELLKILEQTQAVRFKMAPGDSGKVKKIIVSR